MKSFEKLWFQLLDHLDREGMLPIQLTRSTPAEIARHVGSRTGDDRVSTFVWGYLYPKRYGNRRGTITEKQAKAIVESFNLDHRLTAPLPQMPPPERFTQDPKVAVRSKCTVCQQRWSIAETVKS